MKKLIILAILITGVGLYMAKPKIVENPNKVTKVPYNNGFYAGNYNPNLPVIDPKKPLQK